MKNYRSTESYGPHAGNFSAMIGQMNYKEVQLLQVSTLISTHVWFFALFKEYSGN